MSKEKVSVIIPAYNTELYIENCIESVEKQTYKNFEIIVVNDGSTDLTLDKINKCISKYDNIKLINITNHGQGYARNIALKHSTGDYILFLDSDDFIERITLEQCVEKIEKDKSDLVVFDWKEFSYIRQKYRYFNADEFFKNNILENEEVYELFKIKHYFTVNKLYSKKFLIENGIKYGEGYIYEDNPFWVNVVVNAKKVSLLPAPLYNVGIAVKSTTRNNTDTNKHAMDYITAIKNIMIIINKKPEIDYSALYNYIMKKFNVYYKKRVPKAYKKQFLRDYVKVMGEMVPLKNYKIKNTLIKIACKHDMFKKQKVTQFYIMYKLFIIKRKLRSELKKIKRSIKREFKRISTSLKYIGNNPSSYNNKIYNKWVGKPLEPKILFMGFDMRYTGNSRYLFEKLKEKNYSAIKFVADEDDGKYFIKPNSKEMYEELYSSKIVIFESWIPEKFKKRGNQIWIQLWHGTPLKKMLYDSPEKEIMETSPKHRIQKFNDIQRWNYLLSDNPTINKYFETSLLVKQDKIINYGYPRVKYLIENKNNDILKQKIKEKVGVNKNKKIILYLPTWRDYNYGKTEEEFDRDYMLNSKLLKENLPDDFEILEKNHTYLQGNDEKVIHNTNIETQELLLIADYLITDYSSVMFDGFAIDLPVIIYANDYDKYTKVRGVYQTMWDDLKDFTCDNLLDITKLIKNYDRTNYDKIKDKYTYKNIQKEEIEDFIADKLVYKVDQL